MSWDSPLPTKLFLGAAVAVLVAGWAAVYRDTPVLSAPPAVSARAASELRDAVASPALPMAGGGWFQAAALGRAARIPPLLNPANPGLPPRATSGRAVFTARRVIVDRVRPGVPEPAVAAGR
ncbi:MAG: hypothetical protein HY926_03810 [Elusimicrobia bacterium]|nr:hypothetical protein [Elusimicrobiota bacterium]